MVVVVMGFEQSPGAALVTQPSTSFFINSLLCSFCLFIYLFFKCGSPFFGANRLQEFIPLFVECTSITNLNLPIKLLMVSNAVKMGI